jgi:hypothetical protein
VHARPAAVGEFGDAVGRRGRLDEHLDDADPVAGRLAGEVHIRRSPRLPARRRAGWHDAQRGLTVDQVQDDVGPTLDVVELLLAGVDSLIGANLGEEEMLGAAALGDLNGEVPDPARRAAASTSLRRLACPSWSEVLQGQWA